MATCFAAYLLTCAIEIPIVVGFVRLLGWTRPGRTGWLVAIGIGWLLQLTHPVLWLVAPTTWARLWLAELVVVLIEGLALAVLVSNWAKAGALNGRITRLAVLVALVANAASLLVGLLVQAI